MLEGFEIKDYVNFLLGTGGFGLGVANLVRSVASDRVKLSVVPSIGYLTGNGLFHTTEGDQVLDMFRKRGLPLISIEVTNLSKFPVVITDIGFCNQHPKDGLRMPFLNPTINEGREWPTRLEPRVSVSYRTRDPIIDYPFNKKACAYARTACGHFALGSSKAMKAWLKQIHLKMPKREN